MVAKQRTKRISWVLAAKPNTPVGAVWVGVGMVSVGCHGGVVVVRGMVFVVIAAVAVGVDDEDGLDGSSGGVRWR
ncbi:hypothetical protein Tco_0025061 [Tanacetum coccineum]